MYPVNVQSVVERIMNVRYHNFFIIITIFIVCKDKTWTSGLEQQVNCGKCPTSGSLLATVIFHNIANPITEIPEIRAQIRERRVILHFYVGQCVRVW